MQISLEGVIPIFTRRHNVLAEIGYKCNIGQGEQGKLRLMREEAGHQNKFYYPSQTAFWGLPSICLSLTPADHLWIEAGDFPEHKVKLHNLDGKQWQPYHFLAFNPKHVHLPSIGKRIHFCLTFSKCSAVKLWFSPGALIYTEKYNTWPICFSLFTGINNINTIPTKPEAGDVHFENNKG